MINLSIESILILLLIAFIVGMAVGVSMSRPRAY
jgi:hypothetical protein